MLNLALSFIGRYWLHIAIVAALGFVANYLVGYGEDRERAKWERKEAIRNSEAAKSASEFTISLITGNKENEQHAQDKINELNDTLDAATGQRDGLREQLARLSARYAANSSRASDDRKTAAATIRMLTDLLQESDRLAGIYAESADRSRIAGLACEKYAIDLRNQVLILSGKN